jgi:hypothetical protein
VTKLWRYLKWYLIGFVAGTLIAAFVVPLAAYAQIGNHCGSAAGLEKILHEQHGESPAVAGVVTNVTGIDGIPQGAAAPLFVVTLSKDGNWTFYIRNHEIACIIASGISGAKVDAK